MAIPDFQSVMLPLVKALGDGQERTMRAVTDLLAESFHLSDQEREELLPSGQQSLFNNRVNRRFLGGRSTSLHLIMALVGLTKDG